MEACLKQACLSCWNSNCYKLLVKMPLYSLLKYKDYKSNYIQIRLSFFQLHKSSRITGRNIECLATPYTDSWDWSGCSKSSDIFIRLWTGHIDAFVGMQIIALGFWGSYYEIFELLYSLFNLQVSFHKNCKWFTYLVTSQLYQCVQYASKIDNLRKVIKLLWTDLKKITRNFNLARWKLF